MSSSGSGVSMAGVFAGSIASSVGVEEDAQPPERAAHPRLRTKLLVGLQDAVSVGKLKLDDAMIDGVYDLLSAIFKRSREPRKYSTP